MKHISDQLMHAMLDGELKGDVLVDAQQHLKGCVLCQERRQEIARRMKMVDTALSTLQPAPRSNFNLPQQAYRRFLDEKLEVDSKMKQTKKFRPVWVIAIVLALFLASFALPQTRALAGQFLDLFLVKNVTVLTLDQQAIDTLTNQMQSQGMEQFMQMFSDQFKVLNDRKASVDVYSAAAAASQAGFAVKQVPGMTASSFHVEFGTTVSYTVDQASLQQALDSMQIDYQVDPALDGTEVTAVIPNVVTTQYGDCSSEQSIGCLELIQAPSPVVTTSKPVDMASIVSAGLQFLGWDAARAEDYANSIDWTSTLVLPLPSAGMQYQKVTVNGNNGIYVDYGEGAGPHNALVWTVGNQLYALMGNNQSADQLVSLANQVQ